MTRADIIRMAREVGILDFRDEDGSEYVKDVLDDLERFAALVAAAEREACAKVCDEVDKESSSQWPARLATMIRARSTP